MLPREKRMSGKVKTDRNRLSGERESKIAKIYVEVKDKLPKESLWRIKTTTSNSELLRLKKEKKTHAVDSPPNKPLGIHLLAHNALIKWQYLQSVKNKE